MTTGSEAVRNDLVGLSVTGRFAYFPGLATERVQPLESLDPMRLAALLEAAETAHFFTRAMGDTLTPPDAHSYHLRLSHAERSRALAIPEPFATPETITDEDEAQIISSLSTEEEIRTGGWSWQQD